MNHNHAIIIILVFIEINHIMISSTSWGLATRIEMLIIILLEELVMSDPLLLLLLLMMIKLYFRF